MSSSDRKPTPLDDDDFNFDLTPSTLPSQDNRVQQFFEAQQKLKDDFAAGYFMGMKLPLTGEQSDGLASEERKTLQEMETAWKHHVTFFPENVKEFPTMEALLNIALGKQTCPVCQGRRHFGYRARGAVTGLFCDSSRECPCALPGGIQRWMDKMVRVEYRECDLRTLKPSKDSRLSLERQAEEIQILRKARSDNYFFLGAAGTSKTTFSSALLRESLWRNKHYVIEYPDARKSPFCWKVNAEKLFVQNMQWKTSMTSETPAPQPEVTAEKIDSAKARGLHPTLIIEELDKSKLTESRINFLFEIIDAMDGCQGQIIITSNRTLDRFIAMFEDATDETVRVTGAPLMRRLLKNCNVRDYF